MIESADSADSEQHRRSHAPRARPPPPTCSTRHASCLGFIANFKDDEFEVVTATTDEEIKKIGGAGFTKYDERKVGETVISYYRRPKRFSSV